LLVLQSSLAYAQQNAPFIEVLEVRVTNVDVVVTDKDGNPVTGMKPADFEIYEEGKKQDITHFAEFGSHGSSAVLLPESGGEPAEVEVPVEPRKFIFYFDDSNLTLKNRKDIFAGVRKFVAENVRGGDRVMLVAWQSELKIHVPWTSDLGALDAALDKMVGSTVMAPLQALKIQTERLMSKLLEEPDTRWSEIEFAARGYADAYQHDVTMSANAMTRLLASLSGVDGKKVLVVATETLPTFAGAEIFAHLENIRQGVSSNPTSQMFRAARGGTALTNMSRYNLQPVLDLLVRAANATGVTVYGINPKGTSGSPSGKVEQQMPREMELEFAENDQVLAGIHQLTTRTGGTAMIGAHADMALARVGRDLDAYYSLGYRSKPGLAAERKIEVRAKRPGVHVRTRTNIYYRSLEKEMADRVIANHLQSELPNELGVSLESDPVTSASGRPLVPVRVVIPVNMLTLLPDGKGNVSGGFSVFTCTGDGAGGTSGVNVQSQAIHFTAEQAAQMKGRRIGFAIQVPIEKGRHSISIGVVDHVSQGQGFATMKAAL
jgi:VWFA-related protein